MDENLLDWWCGQKTLSVDERIATFQACIEDHDFLAIPSKFQFVFLLLRSQTIKSSEYDIQKWISVMICSMYLWNMPVELAIPKGKRLCSNNSNPLLIVRTPFDSLLNESCEKNSERPNFENNWLLFSK